MGQQSSREDEHNLELEESCQHQQNLRLAEQEQLVFELRERIRQLEAEIVSLRSPPLLRQPTPISLRKIDMELLEHTSSIELRRTWLEFRDK